MSHLDFKILNNYIISSTLSQLLNKNKNNNKSIKNYIKITINHSSL